MTTEQFANNASSTLNGAINSSVTSLVVTSATKFSSAPQFRILIDSEYMLVTAVAGTTFTITRGIEGSTAASHSNGATVSQILTAGSLPLAGAIIVDGGSTSSNLRTQRTNRNAIDNTKNGIVALGTDTTGTAPGATSSYCVILGGDACSASGNYACAGGHTAQALGDASFAFGDQAKVTSGCTGGIAIGYQSLVEQVAGLALGAGCHVTTNGNAGVALGETCTSSAPNAMAIGFNSTASGTSSVALGDSNIAAGDFSFACGVNSRAPIPGSWAHSSGTLSGAGKGTFWIDIAVASLSGSGTLKMKNGSELDLSTYALYTLLVEVTFQGSTANSAKIAGERHMYQINMGNPGVTIVSDTVTWDPTAAGGKNFSGRGWSIAASNIGGTNTLRFTVSPGVSGDTITVFAKVQVQALAA